MKVTGDFLKKALSPRINFEAFMYWADTVLFPPTVSRGAEYVLDGYAGKELQEELIKDIRNAERARTAASEYETGISGEGLSLLPSTYPDEELIGYFYGKGLNYSRGYKDGHPGVLSLLRMKRYLAAEEAVRRLEASS
jgi:hypothetical protein